MTASNAFHVADTTQAASGDSGRDSMAANTVHAIYTDSAAFKAATAPVDNKAADAALGNLTLIDDHKTEAPASTDQAPSGKSFWTRLGEAFTASAGQEAGLAPAESLTSVMGTGTAADSGTRPQEGSLGPPNNNSSASPGDGSAAAGSPSGDVNQMSSVPSEGSQLPSSDAQHLPRDRYNTPDGGLAVETAPPTSAQAGLDAGPPPSSDAKAPPAAASEAPVVRLTPPAHGDAGTTSTGADSTVRLGPGSNGDVIQHPSTGAPAKPGQEHLNKVLGSVLHNIGKPVQELEKGINPRLGCARMLSHALHEADPSFPETSNTAEFRRALKEHGYEEVTVRPGDPAVAHSHAGDVIVGSRPDGMPSHVALSMGDGTVFNNNSDSGKGQIDSLDQFNQSMHDSKGHWQKNGFSAVTIFRKKEAAPAAAAPTAAPETLSI